MTIARFACPPLSPIHTANRICTDRICTIALDGFVSARAGKNLYSPASRSGGRLPLSSAAQPRFLARDVVARDRNHALPLGQLDLEYHHVLLAERHLRRREIEFPHAQKRCVVDLLHLLAMREEALAPVLQRLGVVQPQDLDVGDQQPGALDRRQHLGQRRDVAAGEDVFGDPRIGDAGPFGAADRMQQHHAVVGEQVGAFAEERVVVADADMLEHADRDDAVEPLRDVAVVLQAELDAGRRALAPRRARARARTARPRA